MLYVLQRMDLLMKSDKQEKKKRKRSERKRNQKKGHENKGKSDRKVEKIY